MANSGQGHTVSEEIGGARGLVKRAARVSVCIHFPASPMAALAEGAIALIWSHADSKSQPCIPCAYASIAVARWYQPEPCGCSCHVRIWQPAESQSWGHVGSIQTSSSISRQPFCSKSTGCSCRWGRLGLQVARRRA